MSETMAGSPAAKPESLGKARGFFRENKFVLLSFLAPFLIMSVSFAVMGVSPFGGNQILVTDLWHQYFPFLADYQEKLKTGQSLFYTWSVGGGTNFLSLAAYYLASPMNLLTVFVPAEHLREFLTFSVVFKIALGGMFTAIFLRYAYKKNDFSLIMFSACFSTCAFLMGYYWNTIWIDTVILTPLVAMGTLALLKEKKFRLFVISLALSVLSNYYIGFFTCIFVFLMFTGYYICEWKGPRDFFAGLGRTALFSAVALALTAFLLLPAFFGLQTTHATGSSFPTDYAINIGKSADFAGTMDAVRRIITNTLSFIEPNTKEAEALPNIYCGTICLVLGFVFLTSKRVRLREKIFDALLLLFLILSVVIRQLDYIWHGFHFTNMIPYRFSYLFSFIMVVMAFRAFSMLGEISWFSLAVSLAGTVGVLLMAIKVQPDRVIIATAAMAIPAIALLFTVKMKLLSQKSVSVVLLVAVLAEAAASGIIGVRTNSVTSAADYPLGTVHTAAAVARMKELEKDTAELWRAETTYTYTLNGGALNHYNGISMFNSLTNEKITLFMQNFGLMGWQSGNRYTYAESSPVSDLFMNLKYLIARDGLIMNTYSYREVFAEGDVKLYENLCYLPMGFMAKTDLLDWTITRNEDTYDPIENQNSFFRLATGVSGDVYTRLEVVNQSHTDHSKFHVYKQKYGNYSFEAVDKEEAPHLQWNYTVPADGQYFAYVLIPGASKAELLKNDSFSKKTFNIGRPYIMSLGQFAEGDTLSVRCRLEAGAWGNAQIYVAKFNEDVFEEGFGELGRHTMETLRRSGSSMEGVIDAPEGGLFYTSVPYEEGSWTARVDGIKTEITPVGGAMIAFELAPGRHVIKLSYMPKGFIPGLSASVAALAVFAAAILIDKKRRAALQAALPPEESAQEPPEEAGGPAADPPSAQEQPEEAGPPAAEPPAAQEPPEEADGTPGPDAPEQ